MSPATYFIPFHPSYYSEPVTAEELEWFATVAAPVILPPRSPFDDSRTEIVLVREPGRFVGFRLNLEKLPAAVQDTLARATPKDREAMLALRKQVLQADYATVSSNVMFVIQQRRAAHK